MINVMTGERTIIQLRPSPPLTVADVEAELAERKAEGALIDPENCEIIKYYAEAVDIYGLFDVPDEWSCVGSELFVRTLPDGDWVWVGDLPEETCKAVLKRLEEKAAR
jgi:hypothetical protein